MIRLTRFAGMMSLFVLLAASSTAAQESKTVAAEGVAAIQEGRVDIARDASLEDAQKRAVEQAIGILIDSQTQVENYQLISDKILSQTKGYIKRYNVSGEVTEGTLLRVRINAEVALGKLNDDLSGIGILLGQMHKPRTMILIAEQNMGNQWYAWWWGPGTGRGGGTAIGQQTDMGVVENTFMDKFIEKGFEFIDHQVAAKNIKVTSAYKIQELNVDQARTLGSQADAEVVIIGKAFSKPAGSISGMISAQADLSVRAVRTDTGQVIASATTHSAAVHISDTTAGTEALRKAAADAADQMITKILTAYSREVGGTRSINITITGLDKTRFVKFKDVLRNQVRSIKDLHERSFSGTTAKVSVDSKSSTQVLSDELLSRNFGSFTVEVIGSTANSLELKITPK